MAKILKTVRPEMGCYYYTRRGYAAYVAYACDYNPLPKGAYKKYPHSLGFTVAEGYPCEWNEEGFVIPNRITFLDLVEKITIECAFQYPNKRKRPKVKTAKQMGMLI